MPRYVAWPVAILSTILVCYVAKPILVPLLLAFLLAQLLIPIVKRLEIIMPRFLAVFLSLCLVGVVLTGVLGIVSDQVISFQKSMPNLQQRLQEILSSGQNIIGSRFGFAPMAQIDMVKRGLEALIGASGHLAMMALTMTMSVLSTGVLVALFVFLMLYYREHFRRHFVAILAPHSDNGVDVIDRILDVSQRYVAGLLTVIAVVGALDTIGFLLVRSPFPVGFGLLGGLAVLIPYVGIFIVAPASALLAWVAVGKVSAAVAVLLVFGVIHFLEGNIITPYFVGHKVNLNPLTSLLAVLIGGELWGPAGMLLFIPLIGMLQIVFEMVPGAEPVAHLIGNIPGEGEQVERRWLHPWQALMKRWRSHGHG